MALANFFIVAIKRRYKFLTFGFGAFTMMFMTILIKLNFYNRTDDGAASEDVGVQTSSTTVSIRKNQP